ncbi:MAG: DUF748 domain-containing protein [Betaproteobacteria bacterium]|nr:DUF748 domain-containing protein [Betaproteobacteria bacterium]
MATASAPTGSKWRRRLRNAFIALAVVACIVAVLGFLVVPPIAKAKIEALASSSLGRRATLGKLSFDPFTLHARLTDFALADRDPARTLLKFATLDVDMSIASLWHWAPVLDAVRLVRPHVELVRNGDGNWNIQDLIDRVLAPTEGPTARFSVDNIEVDDGSVSIDDRVKRHKSELTGIRIGLPFLSSIPHDARILVTPRLEGMIDGAKFALNGSSTSPFADREAATLDIDFDALRLPGYAEYASLPQGIKLVDGALTTRLKLAFVTHKGVPSTVTLAGSARLDGLAVTRNDGSPLASAKSIETTIGSIDALAKTIALDRVAIDAPEVDLRRGADGSLELAQLFGAPAAAPGSWAFTIAEAHVAAGVVHITDASVVPQFRDTLSGVSLEARKLASRGPPGTMDVAFDSDAGAHFAAHAEADLAGESARGNVSVAKLPLVKFQPYYAQLLALDLRRGTLDFAADFDAAAGGAAPRFMLTKGVASLTDVEAAPGGERDPLFRMGRTELTGIAFDLGKRSATIDSATWRQGSLRIVRLANGTTSFDQVVRKVGAAAPPGAARNPAAQAAVVAIPDRGGANGWTVLVRKALVEQVAMDLEDRAPGVAVKLRIPDERIAIDDLSNAKDAKGRIDALIRVGRAGRIRIAGALAIEPIAVDWRVDATGIDLVPFKPYFEGQTNVIVAGGAIAAEGRLTYVDHGRGAPLATYAGNVTVSNFESIDRPDSQQLLRWKTLALTGMDVRSDPLRVNLGAVALDNFFARIIVNADGTLNLQQLLAPQSAAVRAASQTAASTRAGVTTRVVPPAPAEAKPLPVSIGHIEVANGDVEFSDFFVKPNYSTHLSRVNGNVSTLSATQAGDVAISGRVQDTAPVDIRGTINPFASQLQLDLTARATDVELPPLTPYSIKYAGYGITKGKLSMNVHYTIDDRRLTATNQLLLDQLTFGEHVDSPTATRLPVLLVVALLKDRNGVINLDFPISGTLDDPQFSIWRVFVQMFVNLFTHAATAPFAVLGSIAGGAGEQLAYVEFAPGHAELAAAAESRLETLARALTDRPALKLDVSGRAVPEVDREGLKNAQLDAAMRTQKQKALVAQGESAPPLDQMRIDAAERPKYLAQVYRATEIPGKPKNFLGIAKAVPDAEMEKLLLDSYKVDDAALTALANARAQAVKSWLVGQGHIAPERVFIVAPKLGTEGIADKGLPTRVDFAIR